MHLRCPLLSLREGADSGWRWWGIHMGHMLNTVKAKAQPLQMLSSIIIVASYLKKKKQQLVLLQAWERLLGFVSFLGSKRCCIFVPIDRVTVCAFVCLIVRADGIQSGLPWRKGTHHPQGIWHHHGVRHQQGTTLIWRGSPFKSFELGIQIID